MSSRTQALLEIVIDLPKDKRAAWRKLPGASKLDHLAKLPDDYGRVEIVETTKSVTARALFTNEAEETATMLIDAFRAAAQVGAVGKGVYFVLGDYQREEGFAIAIGAETEALEKLSDKKTHAKHARLEAFLDATVMADVPPPVTAAETSKLRAASAKALAALEKRPRDEVFAAWERVKQVSITSASFGLSKKDEKRLLALFSVKEPRWGWIAAMPLRLLAELDPATTTPVVLDVLEDPTLADDERMMLFEALAASTDDVALEALLAALRKAPDLEANGINRALAFSKHPRATDVLVTRAKTWLEPVIEDPKRLFERATGTEGIHVASALKHRGDAACRAMLRTIFDRFYAVRQRIPKGASAPADVARHYVETLVRDADTATKQKYFATPRPADSLEKWAAFLAQAEAELAS